MKQALPGRIVAVFILAGSCVPDHPTSAGDPGSPMTIIPEYHKLAEEATSPEQLFSILDTDGNGQIDRTEWQIRKMAIFYMRDRNKDLQLSPNELPGLARAHFAEADSSRDGVLSGFEFSQAAFSQFDKADTNSNGAVDREEFAAFAKTLSASG